MITVFYDGKCGLCSKEIDYYRRIAPAEVFDWRDITQSWDELEEAGVSLVEGLKVLHVMDHQGNLHKGVDAFILIWKQMKLWRVLASIVSLPLFRPIADSVYSLFARWRFKSLKHCQMAMEQAK